MNRYHFASPVLPIILAAAALGLVSCASGPTYAEGKSSLPPIAAGQGRIFVYRPSSFGFAFKAPVKINRQAAGSLPAQGYLYVDRPAGSHEISIATERNHKNSVTVNPGQPSFVHCKTTPGVVAPHFIPNQVDMATGEAGIQRCKLSAE